MNGPAASLWAPEQIAIGMTAEFDRTIDEADILAFAANSGDFNPLHVDANYARDSNYRGRIAHGAFQIGLASALIGMHLPGRNVLLGTVNARFPSPLMFPCKVNVKGEVVAWSLENRAGQLRVIVRETASLTQTAEVLMGFTLHERRTSDQKAVAEATPKPAVEPSSRRVVLVTGASGGLGEAIALDLAAEYAVIGLANRRPLGDALRSLPNVRELQVDLASTTAAEAIADALGDATLYAVVHAAWPGMTKGGLLQAQDDAIALQLAFGTTHLIRLSRLLFDRVDPAVGGRVVALGSIAGGKKPAITVAPYSLGKVALEATVGLLAPEMARKKITVNALCPSYVAVGINRQGDDRQIKAEAARVPMGRICDAADVSNAVRHLLSPAASFLSGEIIGLNGGQL